jgi:hypothetical protein
MYACIRIYTQIYTPKRTSTGKLEPSHIHAHAYESKHTHARTNARTYTRTPQGVQHARLIGIILIDPFLIKANKS